MAILGLKTPAAMLASFPMTLIHYVEAKSRVSSDLLNELSKLQPCLKLCRFSHMLLKTSYKMKIAFPRWKLVKRSHFQLLPNG
jgi:hypothetical protein